MMEKYLIITKNALIKKMFYTLLYSAVMITPSLYSTPLFAQETQKTVEEVKKAAEQQGISVEQIKEAISNSGNPQQAIERAQEMGATEAQIQQILREQQQQAPTTPVEEGGKVEDTNIVPTDVVTEEVEKVEEPDTTEVAIEGEGDLKIDIVEIGRFAGLRYFGYNIFQQGPETDVPVGIVPVDPGYIIGAGDLLRLIVWGDVDFEYELEVNNEGKIIIPKIGPVFVAGTRYEQLRETLKNYLSKFHSGLESDPPSIFMDVSLAQLRSTQIYILGEVESPGIYTLSSYGTAFNALYTIGGPKITGSLREVRIKREGKIVARVDLYDYILKGVPSEDERLRYNDIVFVPTRQVTVGIKGEVLRPAIYELTGKEDLNDLIELAGGLESSAYAFRAQIDRILPLNERIKGKSERKLIDIDLNAMFKENKSIALADGDVVSIFPIIDEVANYVDISGAGIFRPGRYELNNTIITLSDIIRKAEGVTPDVYLPKADLIRIKEDLTDELIEVNLDAALRGEPFANIYLKAGDRIRIYSLNEMLGETTVSIRGYVVNPGTYPLPGNMTLYDLLFNYAGFQDTLRFKNTFIERGDIYRLGNDGETRYIIPFNVLDVWEQTPGADILLQRNDEIVIYNKDVKRYLTREVRLSGAVKEPGTFEWKENMTLADIILAGGGFTPGAWILDAEIARFSPEGTPGDSNAVVINVPIIEGDRMPSDPEAVIPSVLLHDSEAALFPLEKNDHVFIRTNPDFESPKTVVVSGEVYKPGTYVVLERNERVSDIIRRAGGLKSSAYAGGCQLLRGDQRVYVDFEEILLKKKSREDIIVQDRDNIRVPPYPNAVEVIGEVMNPGFYKYLKGRRVKDYIYFSGGKTENGGKIYLNEPSGRLIKVSFFSNPKVRDGSIIEVYPKPPEPEVVAGEKTDWGEVVKDAFAVLSGSLTIIYLIDRMKE